MKLWFARGRAAALLLAGLCAGACSRPDRPPPAYPPAAVTAGERFTLGPFDRDLARVPIALALAGSADPAGLAALETDAEGRELARAACWPAADSRPGAPRVEFVPPADDGGTNWPAGRERHFILSPADAPLKADSGLQVESGPDSLVIRNPHYALTLAPAAAALEGSADVVREIAFGAGGKRFKPACQSQVDLGGRSYFWHFDPAAPPDLTPFGNQSVRVRYGGFFQAAEDWAGQPRPATNLPGVAWRLTLTAYAALPLVQVRFERLQAPPPEPFEPVTFQSILNLQFDISDPECPFKTGDYIQPGPYEPAQSLLAAEGPGALLAILLPDKKTFGRLDFRPKRPNYFCAEYDGGRAVIRGETDYAAHDVRTFYLLATDKVALRAQLPDLIWSLARLRDADDLAALRRIFE